MKTSYAKIFTTLLLVAAILVSGCIRPPGGVGEQNKVKRFSSQSQLERFLQTNTESSTFDLGMTAGTFRAGTLEQTTASEGAAAPEAGGADEYSTTNIQVEGVDEGDIVKNDGKYIYTISGTKVVIVDAYPAEQANIVAEIEVDGTPHEMFINDDRLVVMGTGYFIEDETAGSSEGKPTAEIGIAPPYYSYTYGTFVHVYDVTDRSNPVLERNVTVSGSYFDSRMIGDYTYVIAKESAYYARAEPVPLPRIEADGVSRIIPATEIYYFDIPDYSYMYTNIIAVNTQSADEDVNSKTYLMGYTHDMHVSLDNIYMVYTKRVSVTNFYDRIITNAILPGVPSDVKSRINEIKNSDMEDYRKYAEIGEVLQDYVESLGPEAGAEFMKDAEERMETVMTDIAKEIEQTVIHKIGVDGSSIEYKTAGQVPGHVLNQFSMDEHNGYFRIATTTGNWRTDTTNHMYVLDSGLNVIGKVEDLAKGERIYSTRFVGDKGYMVTFRQIDPLFVIDLSNPTNPQVLGYLKIPGVSDYLHPYDATHLIGVGRDATEQGMMKGMKLSLFDVSDFSNPVEVSTYYIGDRGTNSEALNDHKAFLFDKDKGLLVIPVSLAEDNMWQAWEGAYVFNIDLDSGFTLRGRITHQNETEITEDYGYKYWTNYDHDARIRRSLYMGNVLYTVSNKIIKANDLSIIDNELAKVELPYERSNYYPYPVGIRGGGGMIEPGVLVETIQTTEAVEIPE
jgi:uncharacterized secreted protein with C-terminal beta-propeller domain